MTYKIMISVSDEIKEMIDEYNRKNEFMKLQTSGICQKALYDYLSVALPKNEPMKKKQLSTLNEFEKPSVQEDKPTIPCPVCGEMFVQTISTRKFCSKKCGTQASRLRKRIQVE